MDAMTSNPRLTTESPGLSDSTQTTPSVSAASTPTLECSEFIGGFPHKLSANLLPALSRDFPKPADEVNVREALERQPGRWSLQGQIRANNMRAQNAAALRLVDDKADKARAFEQAKRELLTYHAAALRKHSGARQ